MKALLFILAILALSASAQNTSFSSASDANTLNFYLYLKNFEVAFYNVAIATYNSTDYATAGFYSSTAGYIVTMRDQTAAQCTTLTSAVQSLGATPHPGCNYTITFTSVSDFLDKALVVEDTMAGAGVGVIDTAAGSSTRQLIVGISTVDARHSTFIRTTTSAAPFPVTVTEPITASEAISAINPYVSSCSTGLILPSTVTCSSGTTWSTTGTTSTTSSDNSDCGNLLPLCMSQCGNNIGVCRCSDGIPIIQCGSAAGMAVSFLLVGSLLALALF